MPRRQLPAWLPPRHPGLPLRRHASPWTPLTLSHSPSPSSPSPSLSHARDRTQLSPPTSSPTATSIFEPLRCTPELRLVPLFLLAKPRKPRITMPSSSSSSPPLLLAGLRRSIRRFRRFPEHSGHPYVTTVSPRVVSPFSPGRFRPLGHSPVLAENSMAPAMSPSSL